MTDGERLEQPAHAVGLGKAARGLYQSEGLPRGLAARQAIRAPKQAEPCQKQALRNRAMHGGTRAARALGKGAEIDMRGQVGRTGIGEGVGGGALADGLERVAGAA